MCVAGSSAGQGHMPRVTENQPAVGSGSKKLLRVHGSPKAVLRAQHKTNDLWAGSHRRGDRRVSRWDSPKLGLLARLGCHARRCDGSLHTSARLVEPWQSAAGRCNEMLISDSR